jgi:hypothetical protein
MPSQIPNLDGLHENGAGPSTPIASASQNVTLSPTSPVSTHDMTPISPSSLQSSLSLSSVDSSASQFLLPIPTPSTNRSQASFAYSDFSKSDPEGPALGTLPPEIASADIAIARECFSAQFCISS